METYSFKLSQRHEAGRYSNSRSILQIRLIAGQAVINAQNRQVYVLHHHYMTDKIARNYPTFFIRDEIAIDADIYFNVAEKKNYTASLYSGAVLIKEFWFFTSTFHS